ncbi:MAG: hypothetical protein R2747_13035 [Pyrinomonadaceae bacterium]
MKKEFFLISEKYERTTIQQKRSFRTPLTAICKECGGQFEWLTVVEAAEIFGVEREDIRENLRILRRKTDEHDPPIH